MILNTYLQSIIYVPLVLGIFLSFRILKLTDLTADGSFVLGAGIYSKLLSIGYSYTNSIIAAICGGFVVGLVLSFIQKNNRVPPIVASILCVFMLHSVNILVMGRPNISLMTTSTPYSDLFENQEILANILLSIAVMTIIVIFMMIIKSRFGLIMRAFGSNYELTRQEKYKPELIRFVGLGISNSLYAVTGILTVHIQNFADVNMGTGISLIGIGSVIIGLQIFKTIGLLNEFRYNIVREMLGCITGVVLYFLTVNVLLNMNINPNLLKLSLGLMLTIIFILNLKRITK